MPTKEDTLKGLIDNNSDWALAFAKKHGKKTYMANDGNGECEIEASSAKEAADEYISGGDWGEYNETFWITVRVYPRWTVGSTSIDEDDFDSRRSFDVTIDPSEPRCTEDEHDWTSPYKIFGGLEENPGVFGHGGGVIIKEVCSHCQATKTVDTWAQNPINGEQGLCSVAYGTLDCD